MGNFSASSIVRNRFSVARSGTIDNMKTMAWHRSPLKAGLAKMLMQPVNLMKCKGVSRLYWPSES